MGAHELRTTERELNEVSGGFGLLRLRDPIPLPQRLRFLGAAERVERVGGGASAVLGPGVVATKGLVVRGEGGLAK